MKTNRFQRGTGCYTCDSCKKRTRATGTAGLCQDCFDLATIQNGLWDNDAEYLTESGYDAKVKKIFDSRPELRPLFSDLSEAVR